ncbi:hypothetical protein RCL1_008866 [Eukaryota sp. TZLM3-RCL]
MGYINPDTHPYEGVNDPRTRGLNNRYLMLIAAFCLHVTIGQVYGFSVFNRVLRDLGSQWEHAGFIAYALGLGGLGYSAIFVGFIEAKIGPKKVAAISGALFFLGHMGCALGVHLDNAFFFFTSYLLSGISFGFGYLAPIPPILQWFSDRIGLANGIAVSGFGMGPILSGMINTRLIEWRGVEFTFAAMGIYGTVIIAICTLFIRYPPRNYIPPAAAKKAAEAKETTTVVPAGLANTNNATPKEAIKSFLYWRVWFTQCVSCFAGVSTISTISPLIQDTFGFSPEVAGEYMAIFAVFNVGGRFYGPWTSDLMYNKNLPRKYSFVFYLGSQALICLALALVLPKQWLVVTILLLGMIYAQMGASFGTLAALVSNVFGSKYSGAIFGFTLSAWATSGLVGPNVVSYFYDRQLKAGVEGGSLYVPFYWFTAILMVIGFISACSLKNWVPKNKPESLPQTDDSVASVEVSVESTEDEQKQEEETKKEEEQKQKDEAVVDNNEVIDHEESPQIEVQDVVESNVEQFHNDEFEVEESVEVADVGEKVQEGDD